MCICSRLLNCVQIVSLFAACLAIAVRTLDGENYFDSVVRSLSLPVRDFDDHKCHKEVPTILTLEEKFQRIEGNGSNGYWTRYQICCEGYKRYKHDWNICVPDCGGKCRNGICVGPNDCECFPGHIKNDDDECVHTCPLGCLNGKCSYDGKCNCNIGYTLDRSGKYCKPVCRFGCRRHQNCTQPDHCECMEGYQMDHNGECKPTCHNSCPFGNCIGPNVCLCGPGYKLKDNICQAHCYQRCYNGLCVGQDNCQCNNGYFYDQHTTSCIPFCEDCINGTCIEPNVCRCFKGYRAVNRACISDCPNGCIGGQCVAPNHCKCTQGTLDAIGHCRGKNETKCASAANGTCVRWTRSWNI